MAEFEPHVRKKKWALEIIKKLKGAGYEAMLTGGCVRDQLLGLIPKDFDIATTALPEQIMNLFSTKPYKAVPTGLDHGTVTVVYARKSFEITTLREDVSTDGRHAKVKFGKSFEEDAKRRDFTINALYLDSDDKVHDYVNGQAHLRDKLVVFVGDPTKRISEDFLRILRFYKFQIRLGFGSNTENEKAIRDFSPQIQSLSKERVMNELKEIFSKIENFEHLNKLFENGVIGSIFQFQSEARNVNELAQTLHKYFHTLGQRFSNLPYAYVFKLGLLLKFISQDQSKAYNLFVALKPSKIESSLLQLYLDSIEANQKVDTGNATCDQYQKFEIINKYEKILSKEVFLKYGIEYFQLLAKLAKLENSLNLTSNIRDSHKIYDDLYILENKKQALRTSKPFFNGEEIKETTGLVDGLKLGNLIKDLRREQLNEKINSKEDALVWLTSKSKDI